MFVAEALEKQLSTAKNIGLLIDAIKADPHFRAEVLAWQDDARMLMVATPMFWSQKCVDMVLAAKGAFNLSEIVAARELLYNDFAFCWFEKPWMSISAPEGPKPMVALSWYWVAFNAGRGPQGVVGQFEMARPRIWHDFARLSGMCYSVQPDKSGTSHAGPL